MDEVGKMLAGTSPIAAVVLLLGAQALQIVKTDLAEANRKRDMVMITLKNVQKRLKAIEHKLGLGPVDDDDEPPIADDDTQDIPATHY